MSDHVTPGSTSPLPASEPRRQGRPKRISHTKSRNGCLKCKNRRVKCDEGRPICNSCSVRGEECVFPSPYQTRDLPRRRRIPRREETSHDEASPAIPPELPGISIHPLDFNVHTAEPYPAMGSSNDLNMHDLALMQHYMQHTCKKMTLNHRKSLVWEHVVPEIAVNHAFLMHLLLALAGVDVLTTRKPRVHDHSDTSNNQGSPAVNLKALIEHHQKGLRGLQDKLAVANDQDMDLLFAGSMLIVGFAFASHLVRDLGIPAHEPQEENPSMAPSPVGTSGVSDRPQIQWLRLVRGMTFIVQHSWATLKLGRFRPILTYSNANDDWRMLGPEMIANDVLAENVRSRSFSAFAMGAAQAISSLRTYLSIIRMASASHAQQGSAHSSSSLDPNIGTGEPGQWDDLFQAQDQSITVVEDIYMRIMYILHLQHIVPCSSDRDIQSEMEEAAVSSWPHLVPEAFISSLESAENLEIPTGFSYVILAHLYLPLSLLDDIWYFGKIFESEIKKIESLIAGLHSPELSQLMAWLMNGLNR